MTLRIVNNVPSINAHRNLLLSDLAVNKTLEKISTGLDIVRASDGPASLIISEQLRSQISGLKQSTKNAETAISVVQTTEAAMEEVNRSLIELRKLATHAANDAANDKYMLEADQQEVNNIIESVNRIANNTTFGSRKLLDGSRGVQGVGVGEGVEFVDGSIATQASGQDGYALRVLQTATQASITTGELTQDLIDEGENIVIQEGGKNVRYTTKEGQTVADVARELNLAAKDNGLDMTVTTNQGQTALIMVHNQYGSGFQFSAASTTAGFISQTENTLRESVAGLDIEGTIDNRFATGKGQILTGGKGTPVEGLQVRYTGDVAGEGDEGLAGRVVVAQNSMTFQVGPNYGEYMKFALGSVFAKDLANGIKNQSGFKSIADIDLRTFQGAQDALLMVVEASNNVSAIRGRLGALQKNNLEPTVNYIRNLTENMVYSESVIREADIAEKTADLVKKADSSSKLCCCASARKQLAKSCSIFIGFGDSIRTSLRFFWGLFFRVIRSWMMA